MPASTIKSQRRRSASPVARPPNLAKGKHTLVNPETGKAIALTGETREVLCAKKNRGGLRLKDCKTSRAEKAKAKK